MTILAQTRLDVAIRRAAVRATLAPSVHNTQPWQFRLAPRGLALYADRERQLVVHDPSGRQLVISCGCALFNARASLAADGIPVSVERFPSGLAADQPYAVITATGDQTLPDGALAVLDKYVESRRTNTRPFTDEQVPEDLFDHLRDAASAEAAELVLLSDAEQARYAESQMRQASTVMQLDPAYRSELRVWRGDRDPELLGESTPPSPEGGERLALLLTHNDHPTDWIRAGEALERVLLEVTGSGFAVGLSSRLAEVPSIRTGLRRSLGLSGYPHVLLRIGVAPPSPATRRRRLVEVLVGDTSSPE